ncbi:leucyl aminopeptidase family protein [Enhygromyxa salina]|uniref:Cytosol aminopeptidase n=1 Tax=Enhygromyxa salina TaxID=215803 RepID=A0A2S9XSM1_9BACT|nr:leucyl aminopeptidase family protein [Enhygromyxa salina]PRP95701.1 Cytosol aminopeptidase [Enhygromyxa salina]
MRISVSERRAEDISADVHVVVFRAPDRGLPVPPLAAYLRGDVGRLITRRAESMTWLETRELATPRVLMYCLGPQRRAWDPELEYLGGHAGSYDHASEALGLRQALRTAGAMIERACDQVGARHAALISWPEDVDPALIIEGLCLRAHDPRAWERSGDGPVATSLRRLTVCMPDVSKPARRAASERLRRHLKIIEATNFARELGDLPSNVGTASGIVERVRAQIHERDHQLELSTISAAEAAAAGMGLFTAVDAGASERGCILRLEHRGSEGAPLVFVGKGLTHDTGGYNLKTDPWVHLLTHDKCGATAVVGAMLAIDALALPVHVIALCPLTENSVDALAYKPGDVLTACNGTTVYVENTDAEGRLVLADVLAWLQTQDPRPELVVDLATMTSTIHAALGEPFAGLYCNEDRVRELLVAAGRASGELLWPMPIHEIHDRHLGHHKADLRNVGVHAGSPSSAAAFLRAFVDYPWAHVDLAGKSHNEYPREHLGVGATGFGCRLLVEFACRFAET